MDKELMYGSCHDCQRQGLRHCGEADICTGAKEYPVKLRKIIEEDHKSNTPS